LWGERKNEEKIIKWEFLQSLGRGGGVSRVCGAISEEAKKKGPAGTLQESCS